MGLCGIGLSNIELPRLELPEWELGDIGLRGIELHAIELPSPELSDRILFTVMFSDIVSVSISVGIELSSLLFILRTGDKCSGLVNI